ncbi:MAG: potassium transporter TrkH [Lachnospiraceae bacterium]|nr:potassium transporter TrkH [Lachnospiraceae bacterium]
MVNIEQKKKSKQESKKEREGQKVRRIASIHLIPFSFLAAILIGTCLLLIPAATAPGEHTDFVTALFTATTSVCVTGLVVVDTYAHWSIFGQAIILILAQLGGLGIITVASLFMMLGRKKFTLGNSMLLMDALNLDVNNGLLRFLTRIIQGTFLVELLGTVLYACAFVPKFGLVKGLWAALFNSVSAFCNAGMDVMGADSMTGWRDDPLVMGVTMVLILLGGLGYVVWFDLAGNIKRGLKKRFTPRQIISRLSEHSKLVLVLTLVLLFGGAVFFFLTEYDNPETIGNLSLSGKLANSLFQSVTLRTAGFTSFPQEKLRLVSCLGAYILMFIGGSPVGTAGGVKTVTFFLVIMNVVSYLQGKKVDILFRRRVSTELMRKASAVVFVSMFTVAALSMVLLCIEPVALEDALYEIVSASATVGLSRGLTSSLHTGGRLVVILAMYLGRIGPIAMAIAFTGQNAERQKLRYAEGRFYVG